MSDCGIMFGKLVVAPFSGGRMNYLEKDYLVSWPGSMYLPGAHIRVRRGFVSDYASVPRVFWSLVPPHYHPKASVLHDYLYTIRWKDSRALCDSAYLAALLADGAPPRYWIPAYCGVRIGGGSHWKSKTPDIVSAWRRGPRLPLDFPGDVRRGPKIGLATPPMAGLWGGP